jgi:hypothetical protein
MASPREAHPRLIMPLNVRALGKASKKLAFTRLFNTCEPNIIMIQETLGDEKRVIEELTKSLEDTFN